MIVLVEPMSSGGVLAVFESSLGCVGLGLEECDWLMDEFVKTGIQRVLC